eukprot:4957152-Pleurochrysis_carterae.AAC.1
MRREEDESGIGRQQADDSCKERRQVALDAPVLAVPAPAKRLQRARACAMRSVRARRKKNDWSGCRTGCEAIEGIAQYDGGV